MKINLPKSAAKRALIIIDVQPATLRSEAAFKVLDLIRSYVRIAQYDAYVIATYSATPDSMFFRQSNWLITAEAAGPTDTIIEQIIDRKPQPALRVHKTLRSVFKLSDVIPFIASNKIEEVHVLGFDINDCVLATAYDALDLGYFSYVIEECSGRTDGNHDLINAALSILRKQNMTNNSNRALTHQNCNSR